MGHFHWRETRSTKHLLYWYEDRIHHRGPNLLMSDNYYLIFLEFVYLVTCIIQFVRVRTNLIRKTRGWERCDSTQRRRAGRLLLANVTSQDVLYSPKQEIIISRFLQLNSKQNSSESCWADRMSLEIPPQIHLTLWLLQWRNLHILSPIYLLTSHGPVGKTCQAWMCDLEGARGHRGGIPEADKGGDWPLDLLFLESVLRSEIKLMYTYNMFIFLHPSNTNAIWITYKSWIVGEILYLACCSLCLFHL